LVEAFEKLEPENIVVVVNMCRVGYTKELAKDYINGTLKRLSLEC